ncbi:MAG: LysE family transporter, partial [Selenomonadaceae bacterium]|nr:LysE family transporter [Selenomonadaceae bacterium]
MPVLSAMAAFWTIFSATSWAIWAVKLLSITCSGLASGVRQGLALTCGLASGVIFHTTLVILGVAVLLQQSPLALQLIKYIGA